MSTTKLSTLLMFTKNHYYPIFLILSKPKRILELGIDKGSTTKYIQKILSENRIDIKYYGFDYEHIIDDLINNDQTIKELVEKNKLQFIKGSHCLHWSYF